MIRWNCRQCGEGMEAPESMLTGGDVRCPKCYAVNCVPSNTEGLTTSRIRSHVWSTIAAVAAVLIVGLFLGFLWGKSSQRRYWYSTFKSLGVAADADQAGNRIHAGFGVWLMRTEHEVGPLENGYYTVFWKAHLWNTSSKVILGTLTVKVENSQGFVIGTHTQYDAKLVGGEQTLSGEVKVPEARHDLIDRIDVEFSYIPPEY